jgi:hypothetical protein
LPQQAQIAGIKFNASYLQATFGIITSLRCCSFNRQVISLRSIFMNSSALCWVHSLTACGARSWSVSLSTFKPSTFLALTSDAHLLGSTFMFISFHRCRYLSILGNLPLLRVNGADDALKQDFQTLVLRIRAFAMDFAQVYVSFAG